ncbi:MAG: Yip1 family protein [Candidatus Gracilibacteria bacterium]|jgi:hypothetical protein
MENQNHQGHESGTHHKADAGNFFKDLPPIPKIDFKSVNLKNLQNGLGDIFEMVKMNKAKMHEVAGREHEGVGVALVYLLVAQLVASLGGVVFGYQIPLIGSFHTSLGQALLNFVLQAVCSVVGLYFVQFVAQKFGGKGSFTGYFRVMGYLSVLSIFGFLTFLPIIGMLAGLWMLVLSFVALKEIHQLSNEKTVFTFVIAFVVIFVISAILSSFGMGFGGMNYTGSRGFTLN